MAADIEHTRVIPLYYEAYSQEFEGFLSENEKFFRAIDVVSRYIASRGIWAIDRGGHRDRLFDTFLDKDGPKPFIIRLWNGSKTWFVVG